MYLSNAKVDVIFALSEEHHFDDESFRGGRDVITAGTHRTLPSKDIHETKNVSFLQSAGSVCS